MERNAHLGDAAELYVLGLLEPPERAACEQHVAACPQCRQRIGEAEETLLALERRTLAVSMPARPRHVPPFERRGVAAWWFAPAVAAALIVGILLGRPHSSGSDATLALVQSHFAHAQFGGAGPAAKAIYARDRSWYYIVVAGTRRYDVYGLTGTREVLLGSTHPSAATSTLFTRSPLRFERLELRENGTAIESAVIR